jgi:hypothetical protein
MSWALRALLSVIWFLCRALLIAWATLAIYYSNVRWAELRLGLAIAFVVVAIWAVWLSRHRLTPAVFVALYLVVVGWWIAIPASHDREWRQEVAVMPRAFIDGDRVRLTGVRNFDYRSRSDFTVRYEEREVQLSHLIALDFYVSYFMEGPVGHTYVSFIFDNAPPLSISIETRPEVGESFDPLGSLFKQFELIYVAGSERDIVGVRTNHRKEEVFLYRTIATADDARRLLAIYLERMNQLADRAEFYHLLSNSCTVNIVRYVRAVSAAPVRFNIRHFLNGWFDAYLYSVGGRARQQPAVRGAARAGAHQPGRAGGGRWSGLLPAPRTPPALAGWSGARPPRGGGAGRLRRCGSRLSRPRPARRLPGKFPGSDSSARPGPPHWPRGRPMPRGARRRAACRENPIRR